MTDHKGLPVHGYQTQSEDKVQLVNHNKMIEETMLRAIEEMQRDPDLFDSRWLSIARTHLEQGFMAWNRAIFQPQRIKLEGDSDAV